MTTVYRTLELDIISAKDLKDVNLFSQMSVYAIVSILGDPLNPQITTTHIHRHAGRNPTWNIPVKFAVNESLAYYNRLSLEVKLISYRKFLPCSTIGKVRIPLKGLLDNPANAGFQLSYQVRKKRSRKSKGTLNLSYKFGDRFLCSGDNKCDKE
ncbi:cold-regulated protein [Medicago truncatula]|uniref:Cold-regulated protein n=1 Tax=Medicago truncatula TaxID=3880 RepID=G7IG23_MEDTR|nr:cold-regulated protein [Medicago truncatula]